MAKDVRVDVRMTTEQRDKYKTGATRCDISLSEWIINCCEERSMRDASVRTNENAVKAVRTKEQKPDNRIISEGYIKKGGINPPESLSIPRLKLPKVPYGSLLKKK